ncbi:MAG: T9SS type A sorting domain-containing protein [Candidatus Marinimicrobia bacterium]|nr:T9SS type A sorting domain-containing protein [Candidatus Neomarinimicrobiota bacterium]
MKKMLLLVMVLIPVLIMADGAPWGLHFTGSGYVDMTPITPAIEGGSFTWAVWINNKPETGDPGDKEIIMCTNTFNGSSFSVNHLLWFIGGDRYPDGSLLFYDNGWEDSGDDIIPDDAAAGDEYFSNDQWTHVAFVYTYRQPAAANTVVLYLNGSLVGGPWDTPMGPIVSPYGGATTYQKMLLGADHDGTDNINDYFEGGMDELTIWNTALDETQIGQLASANGATPLNPGPADGLLPFTTNLVARFQFNPQDLPGVANENDLIGTINSSVGNFSVSAVGPVYCSGLSDYSLPIVLSSLKVLAKAGNVEITWTTESELNNAGFNVYRSEDDVNYEKVNATLIEGAVNSSTPNSYTFTDVSVKANAKYYYKLEDVSTSGETNLHGPVTVVTGSKETELSKFQLGSAYPNPFNPSTTIRFAIAEEAKVKITIYDMAGNLVNTLTDHDYTTGHYEVLWNAMDFNHNPVSAGIYIYQMTTNTGFSQSAKMILIK